MNNRISKQYHTHRDMRWGNRAWFIGMTRKLTNEEANKTDKTDKEKSIKMFGLLKNGNQRNGNWKK